MTRAFAPGALSLLLAAGCGSTQNANDQPTSMHLTAPVDVAAGLTMTIEPHAVLAGDPGVTITIHGTLKVASATGAHARIEEASAGAGWGGLVIAEGGTLDADGLDLTGAPEALHLLTGSLPSHYDHGTISGADTPFDVEKGARLDTAHATVVAATSSSGINGEFHASYLDYEKTGLAGGIIMGDATAIFDMADSTLHATPGPVGGDYVISYASKLVRASYSTIVGSHCAFHFDDVEQFEIDHVTAGAATPTGPDKLNAYGGMLYGSGAGPNVISNSNFANAEVNLDVQGTNGPITITNTYSTGLNAAPDGTVTWAPADRAAAPIADAKPR